MTPSEERSFGSKLIKIAHLYPTELNLYGDSGNILCLKKRLEWRGLEARIIPVNCGDALPDFDLLFIGGGQDREMRLLARDIRKKGDALRFAVQSKKVIFAICGGFQLLGKYYETADGELIKLSGALPFYTVGGARRMIGNTVFDTPFGITVGFENHSGRTYLDGLTPLGKIINGFGNNGEDKTEGLLFNNTFGTYAHGPVLPKNPELADELLSRAAGLKLDALDDKEELLCNRELIRRFK